MLSLPQKYQYAVRAVFELAASESAGPLSASTIAQRQGIPEKFLETILVQLRDAGLVRSKRGRAGGYWLRLPARAISLGDIHRAVEGRTTCMDDGYLHCSEQCPHRTGCAFSHVWRRAGAAVSAVLDGTTVDELVCETQAPPSVRS